MMVCLWIMNFPSEIILTNFVRYIGIVSIACGPKISEKAPGWLKVGSKFLFFAFLLRNSYMLKYTVNESHATSYI